MLAHRAFEILHAGRERNIVLKRKFYQDSIYYVSDSNSNSEPVPLPTILLQTGPSSTSSTLVASTPGHSTSEYSTLKPFCQKVPLGTWLAHVSRLRDCGGEKFRVEFSALQEWEQRRRAAMAGEESQGSCAFVKNVENRYANVVACE